jgi:hypothetical protein
MIQQIIKLKNDIKELSSKQKIYKDQRKTVHNKLDRTVEPSDALCMHGRNREMLRHMFILYGQVRHRPVNYEPTSTILLEKLRKQYFPVSEVKIPTEVIQELKDRGTTSFFSRRF